MLSPFANRPQLPSSSGEVTSLTLYLYSWRFLVLAHVIWCTVLQTRG